MLTSLSIRLSKFPKENIEIEKTETYLPILSYLLNRWCCVIAENASEVKHEA